MTVWTDDGQRGDFGWGSQWSNSQLTQAQAVRYNGRKSYRDFNDLEILANARILGTSPDNPQLLRIAYHPGAGHEEFLADVDDWDDPQTKIGFAEALRDNIKSQQIRTVNPNREQLSETNRAINEGRQAPAEQWSDPMQLLNPQGQPLAPTSAVPVGGAAVPTPGADPVIALQQQLQGTYNQLCAQEQQYQQALNQLAIQKTQVEAQLTAINAAAAASAALSPGVTAYEIQTGVPLPAPPATLPAVAQPTAVAIEPQPNPVHAAIVAESAHDQGPEDDDVQVDAGTDNPPEPDVVSGTIQLPEGV
jgi:hypothetical protein